MENFIDKLAYIFIKENKILMTLSRGKNTWYIPGGKRESGETDEEALVREVEEELSVHLIPDTIRLYGVFEAQAHGHPEGVQVRMTCYTAEFHGELLAASEIEKLDFFSWSQKKLSSAVDHKIFDDLKSKNLIT